MRPRNVMLVCITSYFVGVYSAKSLLKMAAVANISEAADKVAEDLTEEEVVTMNKIMKMVTIAMKNA